MLPLVSGTTHYTPPNGSSPPPAAIYCGPVLAPPIKRSRSPDQYRRMLKFGIDDVDRVIENGVAHAEEGDHMVLGRCSKNFDDDA